MAGASNNASTPGVRGAHYADGIGVLGAGGIGVRGTSIANDAVQGESWSNEHAGVCAINDSGGYGVRARGRVAGRFEGNVEVTGDILLTNGDCAEEFDISGDDCAEPGTVMVIGDDGSLRTSRLAYDRSVVGVIAGAGGCQPAIVLGRRESPGPRKPVALVGKVYCKVDASHASIRFGDLLTTSSTPGHAMKADDSNRAFGALIGKALGALPEGRGLIPILIALQ
jgi:hypothetical protein